MPHQKARLAITLIAWFWFALVAFTAAFTKDFPRDITDEAAYASYALQLRDHPLPPPALERLRRYDLSTRQPTVEGNYLNHPPFAFYLPAALLAAIPDLALSDLRVLGLISGLAGFAVYLSIGRAATSAPLAYAVYACFPCALSIGALAASMNFDGFIFLGGTLLYRALLAQPRHPRWGWIVGVMLVSIKLNGLLSAAFLTGAVLVAQQRFKAWLPWLAIGLFFSLPYLFFWLHYGSPAPMTAAQADLLATLNQKDSSPGNLGFFTYSLEALAAFPRLHFGSAAYLTLYQIVFTVLGISLLAALFGVPACGRDSFTRVRSATAFAFLLQFAIQLVYCYARYRQSGWFGDFYPRYYVALLPGFGLLFAQGLTGGTQWLLSRFYPRRSDLDRNRDG